MVSRVGLRIPLHCSSVGKVLLADLSEGALEEIVKEKDLVKRTDNTITDLVKLKAHIKTVWAQGYAFDDEENEKGIRCVGAPIYNQQGQVIAAISISGPTIRITKQLLKKTLKNAVIKTALDISREFGYQE
jgi:DNA-binding IclR family transcriptional regulator